MEAAESPAKMEVDSSGGEKKDAEAGKPPAAAAPTEAAAEPKEAPPTAVSVTMEAAVPAEEAPSTTDVKKEGPAVIHGTGSILLNGVKVSPPTGGSPVKEEKTEKEIPKPVAEMAASFTPSAVAKVPAIATKPKPSPTGAAAKAKTVTKVAKTSSSSTKLSSKTAAAKAAVSTKSLKKGARKKRKTAGLEEVEEKGALPKTKKVKRKKVRKRMMVFI